MKWKRLVALLTLMLFALVSSSHAAQRPGSQHGQRVIAELFAPRLAEIANRGISMRYSLSREGLRFRNTGQTTGELRQEWWKLQERCAQTSAGGLLVTSFPCEFATLTIKPGRYERDRVYPPTVPLGGQHRAVLIHTSYIEPDADDDALIALTPPSDGVVVVNGKVYTARLTVPLRDFRNRYVYVGESPIERDGVLYANHGFDVEAHAKVKMLLPHVAERLQFKRLGITGIAVFEDGDPGAAGFASRGDVTAGGMVRLSLFGDTVAADGLQGISRIAAHELVHLAEGAGELPGRMVAPWLSEGNAEFISWLIVVGVDHAERTAAAERLELALNRCIAAIGSSSWNAFITKRNGSAPYDCGLVLHVAAAIAGRHEDPIGFWVDRFASHDGLDIDAFNAFAHMSCEVRDRIALLCEQDEVAAALVNALSTSGVVAGPLSAEAESEYGAMLTRTFINRLMSGECDGTYGFSFDGETIVTDALVRCATFKDSLTFNRISGIALKDHAALRQTISAVCARRAPLVLQHDGIDKATLSCSPGLEDWPVLRRIEAERLGEFLERWTGRP